MKTLIVGTGGVGGFYGGLLAKAGNDVTFLARGEHFKSMQESGLRIKSVVGDFHIEPLRVVSSITEVTAPELVLVCVKTYHTEEVGKDLASIVSNDTVIISLQNGIDNDQIMRKYLPKSTVIPGIAYIVSKRTSPGLIEQTAGPRNLIFGARDGEHVPRLDEIEKVMRQAAIEAKNSDNIERDLWIKYLWIIAFAGMTSLCRSSIGPIVSDPDTLSILARCLREAYLVACAHKAAVTEKDFEKILQKTESYKHTDLDAKSSMLVDIENHRQTEIESLHGNLCRLAKQVGVEVPVNEIIYYTVRLSQPNQSA